MPKKSFKKMVKHLEWERRTYPGRKHQKRVVLPRGRAAVHKSEKDYDRLKEKKKLKRLIDEEI